MASVASSSRFAYLALRCGAQAIGGTDHVEFEHECRIQGIRGTAPQLDAYTADENGNPIYVEVKCHEIFDPHKIELKAAYWENIYGEKNAFGFPAKKAKKVICVEIVDQAIEDAKKNASSNGIENAQFYAGSAEDIVPKLIKSGEKPDIVIIDPPRKGSDEVTLSTIIESQPKRVVYVSCNPATLARDINFLNQGGYTLKMVTAVDMFPNTVHVEAVALLQQLFTMK